MYRCITELKGFVIDIDSFDETELYIWDDITDRFMCLFITSSEMLADRIEELYGEESVYKIESFTKIFAPSETTHKKSLEKLGLLSTEIVYISNKIEFLRNAMSFLGGTIWITDKIEYKDISTSPDLIFSSMIHFKKALTAEVDGYYGEISVFPQLKKGGLLIHANLNVDDKIIKLYTLGRYFGRSHYMNQLHPYSTAIYKNKIEGKSCYGLFDETFSKLYVAIVKYIQKKNSINGICSVPVRSGEKERFKSIIDAISEKCSIDDYSDNFKCIRNYRKQKELTSSDERQDNVEGAFEYYGDLSGKEIILIDDVISTGATIKSCIKELKSKGATNVLVLVLAVNQLGGSYWSAENPEIKCDACNSKMYLQINGSTGDFFYSCISCRKRTYDFIEGRSKLIERANSII